MEILQTKDYSLFSTINGNRNINKKKVEKLVEDVKSGFNLLPYCPILVMEVDGKLAVIDGQYRFSKDRYLIGALQAIIKAGKCDLDVLRDKIKQNPMGMDKQGDLKNYIYNIERVYNYKNRDRQTII